MILILHLDYFLEYSCNVALVNDQSPIALETKYRVSTKGWEEEVWTALTPAIGVLEWPIIK